MDYEKRVSVFRGDIEESIHYGAAAVVSNSGELLHKIGNPDLLTFPRSALKFLQGMILIESGAADAFDLDNRHLSLACASHLGETFHVDTVSQWLMHIGLDVTNLACGVDYPLDPEACHDRLRQQQSKSRLFHNCSGKHTAFLTVCQHLGFDIQHYNQLDHPVQKLFQANLRYMLGDDVGDLNWQVDGCTFPAPALRLRNMASAMARFVDYDRLTPAKAEASQRLQQAIAEKPEFMSGTSELAATLTRVTKGRILAKVGAEGFHIAIDRENKLGMALKIADGSLRGINFHLISLLEELDLLTKSECKQLQDFLHPDVLDSEGQKVGMIKRPATL